MRVGVTLPTFDERADAALAGAVRAEELGLDGVFVFDHLWPIGRPDRPALSSLPVLGAVAAATARVALGTLVARIGMREDDELVGQFLSLDRLAPGRVVAGLGTGDAKSKDENLAYGIAYEPVADRRAALARTAARLRDASLPVWVGGGAPATNDIARSLGVTLNFWEADDAVVRASAALGDVTWGGPVPGGVTAIAERLARLADAGATWAVCAWPSSLEEVAEAAQGLR